MPAEFCIYTIARKVNMCSILNTIQAAALSLCIINALVLFHFCHTIIFRLCVYSVIVHIFVHGTGGLLCEGLKHFNNWPPRIHREQGPITSRGGLKHAHHHYARPLCPKHCTQRKQLQSEVKYHFISAAFL